MPKLDIKNWVKKERGGGGAQFTTLTSNPRQAALT